MLLMAQRENPGLDFTLAAIVGDSPSDVETGRRLGLTTVMLAPDPATRQGGPDADHVVPDLLTAARALSPERDPPGSA
jgi:phosphoglycolate phosphatase-like HAD superfamily hydrolase